MRYFPHSYQLSYKIYKDHPIINYLCGALAGQSLPSNVAKKEYGFMESAEILFSEREKPRIIGRYSSCPDVRFI